MIYVGQLAEEVPIPLWSVGADFQWAVEAIQERSERPLGIDDRAPMSRQVELWEDVLDDEATAVFKLIGIRELHVELVAGF